MEIEYDIHVADSEISERKDLSCLHHSKIHSLKRK